MKITAIRSVGLFGETPKGGWSDEIKPNDAVHALVAVHTDAGIVGLGSVFTNPRLVKAGLQVLEPLVGGADQGRVPGDGLADHRRLDRGRARSGATATVTSGRSRKDVRGRAVRLVLDHEMWQRS